MGLPGQSVVSWGFPTRRADPECLRAQTHRTDPLDTFREALGSGTQPGGRLRTPPALDVWRQQSRLPTIGTVKEGRTIEFSDLPLVESEDVARHVHRTAGLYLVKRGGVAHGAPYSCLHIDPEQTVGRSIWRVATDAECRALGLRWCESCG